MSKPRKRYNPRKTPASDGQTVLARLLVTADADRLSAGEIMKLEISTLASIEALRTQWCPTSYNNCTHYYRVARAIDDGMKVGGLAAICDAAWVVLQDIYARPEQRPILSPEQLAVLSRMMQAIWALLPEVPRALWETADKMSREVVARLVTEQYLKLAPWVRHAGIDVMRGHTVKAIAERIGRSERQVSQEVRMVGVIAYTLNEDTGVAFPENITTLRKVGKDLLPTVAALEMAIKHTHREAA